jgi:hypothetical protein
MEQQALRVADCRGEKTVWEGIFPDRPSDHLTTQPVYQLTNNQSAAAL